MTETELLMFLFRLNLRMFEMVGILVHLIGGNVEAVNEILDENTEWLTQQMREIETQGMIDELYGGEA